MSTDFSKSFAGVIVMVTCADGNYGFISFILAVRVVEAAPSEVCNLAPRVIDRGLT